MSYESLLQRLEAAEARIQYLEAGGFGEPSEVLPPEKKWYSGFQKLLLAYDPEVGAAREQLEVQAEAVRRADELLFEPVDEPVIRGYPRPKVLRWYEKYALRGYTQFRDNEVTWHAKHSAPAQHIGDRSVGDSENFFLRRARLIIQGDVSDHVYIYLQPDFAVTPPGSSDATFFVQLRDWYTDIYFDKTQIHRLRVGLSKVPYGWENMQSSSNRVPLDRNDALNSAVRNERDLGIFYYWTPIYAQQMFRYVLAENLKGSGNYGVLGLGVYNGQGGAFVEQNNNLHVVGRITWPYLLENGQIVELSTQAYTGRYTVLTSDIRPLGGRRVIRPKVINTQGIRDERIAWTAIWYPQPIGFQAEWNIGRGPALNPEQTLVEERALYGGYLMALAKIDTSRCGLFYPFVRWVYYRGGVKADRNAPFALIDETELGVEWQIAPAAELTVQYTFTDRTNTRATTAAGVVPYRQFVGQLLRFQFQFNY
ncbi:MAG: porin [Gemmataceae bacterium]